MNPSMNIMELPNMLLVPAPIIPRAILEARREESKTMTLVIAPVRHSTRFRARICHGRSFKDWGGLKVVRLVHKFLANRRRCEARLAPPQSPQHSATTGMGPRLGENSRLVEKEVVNSRNKIHNLGATF